MNNVVLRIINILLIEFNHGMIIGKKLLFDHPIITEILSENLPMSIFLLFEEKCWSNLVHVLNSPKSNYLK